MSIEHSDLISADALTSLQNSENLLYRRAVLGTMAGGALALLTGCGTEAASQEPTPTPTTPMVTLEVAPSSPPSTPEAPKALFSSEGLSNASARKRAESIISTFENSTTTIQYGYAEYNDDGRGITAGRSGFTSGTADLLEVVTIYEQNTRVPQNALRKYVKPLQAIEAERQASGEGMNDSIKGLAGFEEAWKITSQSDPELNKAQDRVYEEMYFDPAMKRATETGIHSAVGQLIILDSIIQHGEGDASEEADGLPAMLAQAVKLNGTPKTPQEEIVWLGKFLTIRQQHLQNPQDEETAAEWRESIPRVTALRSILDSQNYDLKPPLSWKGYDESDQFTLTA